MSEGSDLSSISNILPSDSEEYDFNDSASNYSDTDNRPRLIIRIKKPKMSESSSGSESDESQVEINRECLYGPIELTAKFDYEIHSVENEDTEEIVQYAIDNFDGYFRKKEAQETLADSVFTRKIVLNTRDLNNSSCIIGLIYANEFKNSYSITHLSIHKIFRNQGLAKMLLSLLAEYIKLDNKYPTVELRVNKLNVEALSLYKSMGFKKTSSSRDIFVMKISSNLFVQKMTK